jgi:pyruvate formate lyase activating enzyme
MTMSTETSRAALLQEPVGRKVRCLTCERRCLLIEGGTGWCQTRVNHNGVLHTLIYGSISSLSANPIEKKPFYHFYPGSKALTAGSWSCNFGCPWCQNWDISRTPPPAHARFMSPETFVQKAQAQGCQGTSISFNEPTLSLEWSLDVFRLAKERGLYNTFVTNGYMTAQALHLLTQAGLDAMNVDLKGNALAVKEHCKGINVEQVWARCLQARELGLHLEVTTLVIPGVNDDHGTLSLIAERIHDDLGPDTPWHVSGYFPAYRFKTPPTSVETLERAWKIGGEAGLKYVYLGNIPGHPHDNTYCPECGLCLVLRYGFDILRYDLQEGCCPQCGTPIAGVGL